MNYIVICKMREPAYNIRVVGPFVTQQAAVAWAHEMRASNHLWDYFPDVMDPAPEAIHV